MKKIAIEEHVLPPKYLELLHSRKEYPKRDYTVEKGKRFERQWLSATMTRLIDPAKPVKITDMGKGRLKEMDEAGIDMQVLSLSIPGVDEFNAKDGTAAAKMINDELAAMVQKYPKRFVAFAAIAPQDPIAAAKELERAVKQLGAVGTMINSHIHGEYLDNQKFWPVLEKAEKLDVPIYIHPKVPNPAMVKPYQGYPGLTNAMLGFAAETSLHAMRMILSGVFDKFPKVKIILGHLGEAIPFWLWRLDSRFDEELESDPTTREFYKKLKKKPSQYFRDNFYVTTSGMFWEPPLKFVIQVLGSDKVLFAADYPYESSKLATEFIDAASISASDKANVCHRNAERLFKL
jgi:5-carboxyvanillate decarboxylase